MRFTWVIHIFIVLGILLCAISPFFAVAYAGTVAESNGCELNEGGINPCVVNGTDLGGTLYSLGMLGWFGLVSFPLGLAAAALYILLVVIYYLVKWLVRRRAARAAVY